MHGIADKLTYGALCDPQLVRLCACALNYSLIVYFRGRASCSNAKIDSLLVRILAVTVLLYTVVKGSCGVSSLWCFAFGAIVAKTGLDWTVFTAACAITVVPWVLRSNRPELWPFPPRFFIIANFAHVAFALLGALSLH